MPQWLQIILAVYLVTGTMYFLLGTGASRQMLSGQANASPIA